MHRSTLVALAGALTLVTAAPAAATTTSCGTVKGVGNGTSVTKVTTTSGSCTNAKTVAKKFARSRIAPPGYTCKEKFTATTKANVTCTRPGRKITFKVAWNGSMPLPPAAATPLPNSG
jgi:uncharacterized low-complexity protein